MAYLLTWTMWQHIWLPITLNLSRWTCGRPIFYPRVVYNRWPVASTWRSWIWVGGKSHHIFCSILAILIYLFSYFYYSLREATLGDSLYQLLTNCPKLKKLFLSAVRGITERDLIHIATLGKNLEQLDLMGILNITHERVYE